MSRYKVQQGIEGSNCSWRNKGAENDSRINLKIWGTYEEKKVYGRSILDATHFAFNNGKDRETASKAAWIL